MARDCGRAPWAAPQRLDDSDGEPMLRALNALLLLATLAATVVLYALKHDTRRLELRVEERERALERLENDVRILRAERAHLARPERLEILARTLGLTPIGHAQYLRLSSPDANATRSAAPGALPSSPSRGRPGD